MKLKKKVEPAEAGSRKVLLSFTVKTKTGDEWQDRSASQGSHSTVPTPSAPLLPNQRVKRREEAEGALDLIPDCHAAHVLVPGMAWSWGGLPVTGPCMLWPGQWICH